MHLPMVLSSSFAITTTDTWGVRSPDGIWLSTIRGGDSSSEILVSEMFKILKRQGSRAKRTWPQSTSCLSRRSVCERLEGERFPESIEWQDSECDCSRYFQFYCHPLRLRASFRFPPNNRVTRC